MLKQSQKVFRQSTKINICINQIYQQKKLFYFLPSCFTHRLQGKHKTTRRHIYRFLEKYRQFEPVFSEIFSFRQTNLTALYYRIAQNVYCIQIRIIYKICIFLYPMDQSKFDYLGKTESTHEHLRMVPDFAADNKLLFFSPG